MASTLRARRGFTLVELMITLTVIVVLMLAATPSFLAMRQRAALRGAAEQALSLWNQARFEAAKRNADVVFGVKKDSDGNFCLGLTEATTVDHGVAPCDCLTSTTACSIGQFPVNQAEWADVTLSGDPTIGADDTHTTVVLDPKRSALTDATEAGSITFNGPPGNNAYQLNLVIDQFGRGTLCETESASSKMSDYATRRCTPP